MAVQPYSPLSGGFLTGKYKQNDPNNVAGTRGTSLPDGSSDEGKSDDRLSGDNPFGDSKFTERNWEILNVVKNIAQETGYQPAQIALNWLLTQQSVASTLIGASKAEQLTSNIEALTIELTQEHYLALLNNSQPSYAYPASLFNEQIKRFIFAGNDVAAW
ncbi:aldo/keto reductase [Psychrobacter alimentarius]|uniref:aldo/keto reductase n=1 Tax=Psychrobacter alimentarius TaxID=261164 RepID=UPI001919D104|nr:aldo/keto reductase [Psychrobacter alimentarius]